MTVEFIDSSFLTSHLSCARTNDTQNTE